MTVWIAIWQNESGDHGVDGFWSSKPTDDVVHSYFETHHNGDFVDGEPFIYWKVEELKQIG